MDRSMNAIAVANLIQEISTEKKVNLGNCCQLFTPAYWKFQYEILGEDKDYYCYKFSDNILEEVVACLLGGYGIKAEIGHMAFYRLKESGLIKEKANYEEIENALQKPFLVKDKYKIYRFFKQKASYISSFLGREDLNSIPNSSQDLRAWLLTVKGIGLKTASWITRNYCGCDSVAIIDIHIYRAGVIAGIFPKNMDIRNDYYELEERYLTFCKTIDVRPSIMDSIMWSQMKDAGHLAISIFNQINQS